MKRGKESSKGAVCDAGAPHRAAVARIISAIAGKATSLLSGYDILCLALATVIAEANNTSGAENAVVD